MEVSRRKESLEEFLSQLDNADIDVYRKKVKRLWGHTEKAARENMQAFFHEIAGKAN